MAVGRWPLTSFSNVVDGVVAQNVGGRGFVCPQHPSYGLGFAVERGGSLKACPTSDGLAPECTFCQKLLFGDHLSGELGA